MMAVFALSCAFLVEPLKFAPNEFKTQLAPAFEISAEEKRRLARLKGLTVADHAADLLEAPPPRLLGGPSETTSEPPDVAEAAEDDFLDAVTEEAQHLPVDLDEVAGKVQRVAPVDAAQHEITQRQPFAAAEKDQATLSAIPSAAPEEMESSADQSEQPLEPIGASQNDSSVAADGGGGRLGEMAYTLAQFNRLSAVLVARSEAATMPDVGPGASADGDGAPSIQMAEAARRRMKILHSLKFVQAPGGPTSPGQKDQPVAPQQPRALDRTPDRSGQSPAQPLDPAQKRMQVLRSVERFIQTAGLATPSADEQSPGAAATDQKPEELGNVAQNKPTVEATIAHDVPADLPDTSAKSDLSPSFPTTVSEEIVAAARSSSTDLTEPARSPVETEETPRLAVAMTEMPAQLLQPDKDNNAVEPIIGEEVYVELAHPVAQSDRTPPLPATAAKEQMPAFVDVDRPVAAQQPHEQWANEVEWPQQWRSDSLADATAIHSEIAPQQSDNEPLAVPTAATASESIVPAAENIAQGAHAVSETESQPSGSREKIQAPATVPAAKPRAAAKASAATMTEPPELPEKARWGEDIEWPEQWRK